MFKVGDRLSDTALCLGLPIGTRISHLAGAAMYWEKIRENQWTNHRKSSIKSSRDLLDRYGYRTILFLPEEEGDADGDGFEWD